VLLEDGREMVGPAKGGCETTGWTDGWAGVFVGAGEPPFLLLEPKPLLLLLCGGSKGRGVGPIPATMGGPTPTGCKLLLAVEAVVAAAGSVEEAAELITVALLGVGFNGDTGFCPSIGDGECVALRLINDDGVVAPLFASIADFKLFILCDWLSPAATFDVARSPLTTLPGGGWVGRGVKLARLGCEAEVRMPTSPVCAGSPWLKALPVVNS